MAENKTNPSPRAAFLADPVMALFLGACPAMALTGNVLSAIGIGAATMAVMVLSNLVIGALRNVIGEGFIAKLVVISFFASAVGMLMNAYFYSVAQQMGVYLAVLSVSILAFHSAERAGRAGLGAGLSDALVTGIAFTAVLFCVAAVRELLGSASFAGVSIAALKNYTVPIMAQAPGGFIVLAIAMAVLKRLMPGDGELPGGAAVAAVGGDCAESEEAAQ